MQTWSLMKNKKTCEIFGLKDFFKDFIPTKEEQMNLYWSTTDDWLDINQKMEEFKKLTRKHTSKELDLWESLLKHEEEKKE